MQPRSSKAFPERFEMKDSSLRQMLRKAERLSSAGRQSEARHLYLTVLEKFPANQTAAKALKSLEISGRSPADRTINELESLYFSGEFDQLGDELGEFLSRFPESFELWNLKGALASERKLFEEAARSFLRVTGLNPTYAFGFNNAGVALQEIGQVDRAIQCFKRAIELNPGYVEAHANLGVPLMKSGNFEQAKFHFDRALEIEPNNANALNNKGTLFLKTGDYERSKELFLAAIQSKPNYPDALTNLGIAYASLQLLDKALESFIRALDLSGHNPTTLCHAIHVSKRMCDWGFVSRQQQALVAPTADRRTVSPWSMLAMEDDPINQRIRSEHYTQHRYPSQRQQLSRSARRCNSRIRVGYFSNDFYGHASLFLISGLLREHDLNKFEVILFSYGVKKDDYHEQLKHQGFSFYDVSRESNSSIYELAKRLELDVAIDLKGYTEGTRSDLFSLGLAPIQISYLGYPGTMGAPWIDYLIADKIVIPEDFRSGYSESVIYLPNCYQPNDNRRKMTVIDDSRSDHGLPEQAFVLCCFNSGYKISPVEFDIWMRILAKIPDSVLWLYANNNFMKENLLNQAESRGIPGDRIVYADNLPPSLHLGRHKHADLFVDTFNVNAHTTASDALWAGLPVVTKCGRQFAARAAASMLSAVGLEELVTYDDVSYENLILELAQDRGRLASVRQKLLVNKAHTPLFDTASYTRSYEKALTEVVARFDAHQPVSDLEIFDPG